MIENRQNEKKPKPEDLWVHKWGVENGIVTKTKGRTPFNSFFLWID